jgi:lipoprotein
MVFLFARYFAYLTNQSSLLGVSCFHYEIIAAIGVNPNRLTQQHILTFQKLKTKS